MNYFVKVGFFVLFIAQVPIKAQNELEVFNNQKEVELSAEAALCDINSDHSVAPVSGPSESVNTVVDVVPDAVSVDEAFEVSEVSTTDFGVTDTLNLSQDSSLNAKLVGEREDTEKIITQMIEKEFLKKEKENSFALRHVVLGILAAFCFGVISKYLYDGYCKQVNAVDSRVLILEKNNEEIVVLKKTVADMRVQIAKEINDINEYLNQAGGKKRSLSGRNTHLTFNLNESSTSENSTQVNSGLAFAAAVGAGAKVASTGCFGC